MREPDRQTERADVVLDDRYAAVSDCTGRMLIYDCENPDAWVRADAVVDPGEHR